VIAAARIEQDLARRRSVRTLAAFGAAQLVLGHAEVAVSALEEARQLSPDDAETWIDLSAAYLERAHLVSSDEAASEELKAIQAATRATELAPGAPEAWFNLALAQHGRGQIRAAIRTWGQYLKVETDPGWIDEGQRQLAALEATSN
jgi:Flp pilus assembly protein TadD